MKPRHRHPPQGTHQIVGGHDEERIDAKLDAAQAASDALPNDPDLDRLDQALLFRDDGEIARLVPLLRQRYGARWGEIGRDLMRSMGRWPGAAKSRAKGPR